MCKKNGKGVSSQFLFAATVFAGVIYLFKNYEIKVKLVRKNASADNKPVEEQYNPEYVDIDNSYVTEYASDSFSQETDDWETPEPAEQTEAAEAGEAGDKTEDAEESEEVKTADGVYVQKL